MGEFCPVKPEAPPVSAATMILGCKTIETSAGQPKVPDRTNIPAMLWKV
jgi:hypothetical protein